MARTPATQTKTVEQIAREIGQYSIDAFQFVHNAISTASERVHGPVSKPERRLMKWMARQNLSLETVRRLYEKDELPPGVRRAIDEVGGVEALNRHVTGQQLCVTLRDIAIERWGLLARSVLEHWGVYSTLDFGRIVFALVDNQILSKQPTDSLRDFDRVFDFAEAFDRRYRIQIEKPQ